MKSIGKPNWKRIPKKWSRNFYLSALCWQSGRYQLVLDHLLQVVTKNRFYKEDKARKMMLAVFRVLGDRTSLG